jgi:hypothetical protein
MELILDVVLKLGEVGCSLVALVFLLAGSVFLVSPILLVILILFS